MKHNKKKRLEKAGWKVSDADEFLGLSSEEAEYINLRIRLSDAVKRLRKQRELTQVEVGRVGSEENPLALLASF